MYKKYSMKYSVYSTIKEVSKDVLLEEVLEEVLEGVRGGPKRPGQERLLLVLHHHHLLARVLLPNDHPRGEDVTTMQLSCQDIEATTPSLFSTSLLYWPPLMVWNRRRVERD